MTTGQITYYKPGQITNSRHLIPLRLRVGIFAAIVLRMYQFCIGDFVHHLANVLLVGPLLRGPRAN